MKKIFAKRHRGVVLIVIVAFLLVVIAYPLIFSPADPPATKSEPALELEK